MNNWAWLARIPYAAKAGYWTAVVTALAILGVQQATSVSVVTHRAESQFTYPRELEYLRLRIREHRWEEAVEEIKRMRSNGVEPDSEPILCYLEARVLRNLAEQDEWWIQDDHGRSAKQSLASELFERARGMYMKVVDSYPQHFLADDSLGWAAGCEYRLGNYVSALRGYLRQQADYPKSDSTLRNIRNDLILTFDSIIANWDGITPSEQDAFLGLVSQASQSDPGLADFMSESVFCTDIWSELPRRDMARLLAVLEAGDNVSEFLSTTSSFEHVVHTLPLATVPAVDAADRPPYQMDESTARFDSGFKQLVASRYYMGAFAEVVSLLESAWALIPFDEREELETYFWCSLIRSESAEHALEVSMSNGWRNAVIAIARDLLTLDQLEHAESLADASWADLLRLILADRLASSGRLADAVETTFRIVRANPQSGASETACRSALRWAYFLDAESILEGIEENDSLPSSGSLIDRQVEERVLGSEFVAANRGLLDELYSDLATNLGMVRAWRAGMIQQQDIKSEFITSILRAASQLVLSADYESIPESGKVLLSGMTTSVGGTSLWIRHKFEYEERLLDGVLVPFMRAKQIQDVDSFRAEVVPLLQFLWQLLNLGKYPHTQVGIASYFEAERVEYLVNREQVFRTLPLAAGSWNDEAYLLAFHSGASTQLLPVGLGSSYVPLLALPGALVPAAGSNMHTRRAFLMSVEAMSRFERLGQGVEDTWQEVLAKIADALDVQADSNALVDDPVNGSQLRPRCSRVLNDVRSSIPALYSTYLHEYPGFSDAEVVAWKLAVAWERIGNTEFANRVRSEYGLEASVQASILEHGQRETLPKPGMHLPEASLESTVLRAAILLAGGDAEACLALLDRVSLVRGSPLFAAATVLRINSLAHLGRPGKEVLEILEFCSKNADSRWVPRLLSRMVTLLEDGKDTPEVIAAMELGFDQLLDATRSCDYWPSEYFYWWATYHAALLLGRSDVHEDARERLMRGGYPTGNPRMRAHLTARHPPTGADQETIGPPAVQTIHGYYLVGTQLVGP